VRYRYNIAAVERYGPNPSESEVMEVSPCIVIENRHAMGSSDVDAQYAADSLEDEARPVVGAGALVSSPAIALRCSQSSDIKTMEMATPCAFISKHPAAGALEVGVQHAADPADDETVAVIKPSTFISNQPATGSSDVGEHSASDSLEDKTVTMVSAFISNQLDVGSSNVNEQHVSDSSEDESVIGDHRHSSSSVSTQHAPQSSEVEVTEVITPRAFVTEQPPAGSSEACVQHAPDPSEDEAVSVVGDHRHASSSVSRQHAPHSSEVEVMEVVTHCAFVSEQPSEVKVTADNNPKNRVNAGKYFSLYDQNEIVYLPGPGSH